MLKILIEKSKYIFSCKKFCSSNFSDAIINFKKLNQELDSNIKLKLYGLYKQAVAGNIESISPGSENTIAYKKYEAHKKFYGISRDEAQKRYIDVINDLIKNNKKFNNHISVSSTTNVPGINIIKEDKIFKIIMDKPKKRNALTWDMYKAIGDSLHQSNNDNSTSITVITGSGDYFSSGNDIANFSNARTLEDFKKIGDEASKILINYIGAFIDHDKPLIGLVNGPAIGIAVTTLPLYDYVIVSDKATFETPFSKLGITAEGCSTYTFPLLMGHVKATELLTFGKKLTAYEAKERNLINDIIPHDNFKVLSEKKIKAISSLYPEAMRINKKLMRNIYREKLHEINKIEVPIVFERFASKESVDAINKFLKKKK
ncbi:Enoyl-CoA delta isomerase 2, mitochondrial [Strongyloides ratti]|uniref:Enoyl-CoA delta isomerase 2, mitochondrial n=1 Tax=Strongyloides ratti TaxID=34506 RepID=A0A090LFN6_STRRB|nr:Enoyl-CoA delta isomerase 2, mitochondrial [Strongyloides ratti]CEF66295.1 Enoyl-CoA delta isomerase 2, mitochondrial [Strongyloides ratti]